MNKVRKLTVLLLVNVCSKIYIHIFTFLNYNEHPSLLHLHVSYTGRSFITSGSYNSHGYYVKKRIIAELLPLNVYFKSFSEHFYIFRLHETHQLITVIYIYNTKRLETHGSDNAHQCNVKATMLVLTIC